MNINILVKALDGRETYVQAPKNSTILDLKKTIAAQTADWPVDDQNLVWYGRLMQDTDVLGDYHKERGSTIFVLKKPAKCSATTASSKTVETDTNKVSKDNNTLNERTSGNNRRRFRK